MNGHLTVLEFGCLVRRPEQNREVPTVPSDCRAVRPMVLARPFYAVRYRGYRIGDDELFTGIKSDTDTIKSATCSTSLADPARHVQGTSDDYQSTTPDL